MVGEEPSVFEAEKDTAAGIFAHLRMIEYQYDRRIVNKQEIVDTIISRTRDRITILSIALSLNHWVAVNGTRGDIEVPAGVLNSIIEHAMKTGGP
jgi:hypothetical protein